MDLDLKLDLMRYKCVKLTIPIFIYVCIKYLEIERCNEPQIRVHLTITLLFMRLCVTRGRLQRNGWQDEEDEREKWTRADVFSLAYLLR